MSEHRDRILDLALEEELAGTTPPDLSAQIRWQLAQNRQRQSQIGLVRGSSESKLTTWFGRAAGAVAAVALFFVAVAVMTPTPQPALSFSVTAGGLSLQSTDGSSEFFESDFLTSNTYTIFPVLGDRFESLFEESTVLKLAGLGTLNMSPGCVLEVEEMEFSEFGKGFVVGAIVVAVVAGTAQFISSDTTVQAETGERLALQSEGVPSLGDPVSAGQMQQQLADLRAENQRLLDSAARRRAESPDPDAAEAPVALDIKAVITYADFADSLDQMDWAQMGLAAKDLVPKIQELMKALEEGDEMPIGLAGEVQQLNGQILQSLGSLADGQIPGTGINGAFTHPVFAANLMNATLEAAGVALDEGQLRDLQDLTNRFAGEDDSRRGSYGDDVPNIQQQIEEINLRDRFFEQAKASMTPEQLAVLGNGPDGPGPLDLFSGDPAWQQFTKPVKVESRSHLATKLTGNLLRGLKLDATKDSAKITQLTKMIDNWAQAAPDSYFGRTPNGLADAKAFPSAGVTAAARYQAQLFNNMIANLGLSASQRKVLMSNRGVFIPIYTGK